MNYLPRIIEDEVSRYLRAIPVVAVLGPRQCGKSTLVKHLLERTEGSVYVDLERPSDAAKLADPEFFFRHHRGKLICIDEIQLRPELFSVMRSVCDETGSPGQFLISGSASHELLQRSSETLAGRIFYSRLTPFLLDELGAHSPERYLVRGGFPLSYGARGEDLSFVWRENFVRTFLERDLRFWRNVSPETIRRLWRMLAHNNGQTLNCSQLGASLGVADTTVRTYVDLLKETFMLEQVPPYVSNLKKRLVKAPKVYLSDVGITNVLLGLHSFDDLYSHPGYGAAWEQVVLTNIRGHLPSAEICFYRDSNGNELDFVVRSGTRVIAVECKCSSAPTVERGTYAAMEDVRPDKTLVVAPVKEGYPLNERIAVVNLSELPRALASYPLSP